MLSEDFLYQLKQANPIATVFSSYANVIRRGRTYVCLCPFHSEKSPSCTIYPESDSFYCYGCGVGGDTITFIRKIENLEYMEAIRLLAQRANMSVPDDSQSKDTERLKARIYEANRLAARFFCKTLSEKEGEKGRRYFASRQLSVDTIKKYGLGYAPNSYQALRDYLKREGYTEKELIIAGLCREGRNGGAFDTFRDRVMFPIIDLRGNVIAFGGRVIDGDGPKYLNSPESPVFKKAKNLFSLNFAKNVKSDTLILAEGYMDVISINQAGFENVVATLGTALTEEQARIISRYAKDVVIAYDSDGPGQAAIHRAINLFSETSVNARVLKMEGAKDPDEYIKKFGALRFKLLIEKSGGAIEFELEKCRSGIDMQSDAGRVEYLKATVGVLADINDRITRDVYIRRVAQNEQVSAEVITLQVEDFIKKRRKSNEKKEWMATQAMVRPRDKLNPEAYEHPKENRAEGMIIAYILKNTEKISEIAEKIPPSRFITTLNRRIYEKIAEYSSFSADIIISMLGNEFSVEEMGKITQIQAKYRDISLTDREIDDCAEALEKSEENEIKKNCTDDEFAAMAEKIRNKKS